MIKSVKITRSDEPDAVFVISHSPTSPLSEKFFIGLSIIGCWSIRTSPNSIKYCPGRWLRFY